MVTILAYIHLSIAIVTGLLVLYSDEEAFKWFRGKVDTMLAHRVRNIHHAVSTGLALLIITGGLLYAQAAPAYLTNWTFVLKMVIIFALIVNSYFIEKLSAIACERNYKSLSHPEKIPLFLAGVVSFGCWGAAFLCGLIIAYY